MTDNVIKFKKPSKPTLNTAGITEDEEYVDMYPMGPFMASNIPGIGVFAILVIAKE